MKNNLDDLIASCGIGNRLSKEDDKLYFHMFVISKKSKKVYFCGDYWNEDICNIVESTDFIFVFDEFIKIFDTQKSRDTILASLLF